MRRLIPLIAISFCIQPRSLAWTTIPTRTTAIQRDGGRTADALSQLYLHRKRSSSSSCSSHCNALLRPNSLRGQTIVISGASSGLGLESAKQLGAAGANLILTARTPTKGQQAVDTVTKFLTESRGVYYDDQVITSKAIDFDSLTAIQERVAEDWSDVEQIDVLLNNAGIMALPQREITVDRFEKQMQSNHLGPFVFTALLKDKLSDSARIVNVSSEAHKIAIRGLDFDYMWKALLGYNPWISYGQSKLANILFTQELQRRADVAGRNWTVATLHPGGVATNLGRSLLADDSSTSLGRLQNGLSSFVASKVLKTPAEGAITQIWLAAGAPEEDVRGKYYDNKKAQPLSLVATDRVAAERLWKESEELGGVEFKL